MLKLIYAETAPGPDGLVGGSLSDANNSALQIIPPEQVGFADPAAPLVAAVGDWLTRRGAQPKPVVVMVHGFDYNPATPPTNPDNPFDTAYSVPNPAASPLRYKLSWLPLVGECDDQGGNLAENAIAFAYPSIGTMDQIRAAGWENCYQHAVFDLAPRAARALATILVALVNRTPLVRVLAHSLGTRTTMQAIRIARARLTQQLDRVVMLDGAEFCVDAAHAFAGCGFDVFNITNGTDFVLKAGATQFCHPIRATGSQGDCVIGLNGLGGNDRWLDLGLDNDRLVRWFAAGNAPDGVAYTMQARAQDGVHPMAGFDHWACYTNDGNRALVRDLLAVDLMTVARLRSFQIPPTTSVTSAVNFLNVDIPLTPATVVDRQRMIAQGDAVVGIAGG